MVSQGRGRLRFGKIGVVDGSGKKFKDFVMGFRVDGNYGEAFTGKERLRLFFFFFDWVNR